MHAGELREAADRTLAAEPDALSVARLIANLAAGAVVQHLSEFAADIRYARRTLGRSKWFTACAALSFANRHRHGAARLAMTLGAERLLRGYLSALASATSARFGEPWMYSPDAASWPCSASRLVICPLAGH